MKVEIEIKDNALRELERIGVDKGLLMRGALRKMILRGLRSTYHDTRGKLKDRPEKEDITVTQLTD